MSTWTGRLENPLSTRLRDPRATGAVGIVLGAFAAFLAIPPALYLIGFVHPQELAGLREMALRVRRGRAP